MRRLAKFLSWTGLAMVSGSFLAMSAAFLYLNPQVPDAKTFTDVTLRAPLRIYSADGKLIQEFGERLTPVTFDDIPPLFVRALLDTEDKRFFEHAGIDLITVVNATVQWVRNRGAIQSGASTITMQLVKNISGSSEQLLIRKFKEMLLALKMESELSKEEILALYLNVVPFGKHAYGLHAASNTYYGVDPGELDLAQLAMMAGTIKKPEGGNPINGPDYALTRRNLVLQRMLEQGSIDRPAYALARERPITASVHSRPIELSAPYAGEMVRQHLLAEYGASAYRRGLNVYTTLDANKQSLAQSALVKKLNEYDRRHGYRGPEYRRLDGTDEFLSAPEYGYPANWIKTLDNAQIYGDQHPAIVINVSDEDAELLMQDLSRITIPLANMTWARAYRTVDTRGPRPKKPADVLGAGDFVRASAREDGWHLGQVPAIQGALVALDPSNGAIVALAGGYDFNARQFNHAIQAARQPGSNFKPFFYAGALENGLTAASIFNDAPVVLDGGELEEKYRPKNSGDKFFGNVRLREALYRSINLVSLRVILDFGPRKAINYVSRFGFDTDNFPANVQLAFGGGTIALTPLDIATGYAAFANGGYKVEPYMVDRIEEMDGEILYRATPPTVCTRPCKSRDKSENPAALQIVEPRVAFLINSMLRDVIQRGTGTKARRALKRGDLMGKTGTTNDADIWFSGYTHDLVATAWAGFGDNSSVGSREWGSTTPIETWIEFMADALPDEADSSKIALPDGLVNVRIDPTTGLRARAGTPEAIFEFFREELAPKAGSTVVTDAGEQSLQQIF
jgi:penicillin-binding protein 1A